MEMHTTSSLHAVHGLTLPRPRQSAAAWPRRMVASLARLAASLRCALRVRGDLVELARLNDHMLHDIGLDRSDVALIRAGRYERGRDG